MNLNNYKILFQKLKKLILKKNIIVIDKKKIFLFQIVLIFLGIILLIISGYYDKSLTLWMNKNLSQIFGELTRRTMFEGNLPGLSDPFIIFLIISLFLYIKSWNYNNSKLCRWRPYLGFIVFSTFVGSLGMVHSLKWLIGRARPYEVWNQNWKYSEWYEFGPHFITEGIYKGSFPSGHTAVVISAITLSYVWKYKFKIY